MCQADDDDDDPCLKMTLSWPLSSFENEYRQALQPRVEPFLLQVLPTAYL